MKNAANNSELSRLFMILQGIAIGGLIFLSAAFVMAAISSQVDKMIVQNKVADAIRTLEIQYPGEFNIDDKRGIDTYSDCSILQSVILDHGRLWSDMFDTLVYNFGSRIHPCDVLVDKFGGYTSAPSVDLSSYHRYWFGSVVIARIALGMTGVSIKVYRSLMLMLSWFALVLLVATFFLAYGSVSVVFLPLFISVGVGYGLPIMGQSIAHAPEFIVGLLFLSTYCVVKVQQFSLRPRAIFYSVLGSVCVYFDLLDSTVVLVAILLCCQLSAPYAARLLKPNNAQTAPSDTALAREIVLNSSFVVIGGCVAIMLRILGYSIISHTNALDVATAWISNLSGYIIFGSLSGWGETWGETAQPSLYRLVGRLVTHRQIPFHGVFSKGAADSFYVLGFAAWAIAMGLCWKLHRKGVSPVAVALGFVMAAALVPAWFLAFERHTLAHVWMTGRLVTLFCGLGMSLAVLAGWAVAITYSSRGQGEPKPDFDKPRFENR
jgi:hypothetical protein